MPFFYLRHREPRHNVRFDLEPWEWHIGCASNAPSDCKLLRLLHGDILRSQLRCFLAGENRCQMSHDVTSLSGTRQQLKVRSQLIAPYVSMFLPCSVKCQWHQPCSWDSTAPVPLEYSWRPFVVTSGSPAGSHPSLSGIFFLKSWRHMKTFIEGTQRCSIRHIHAWCKYSYHELTGPLYPVSGF